MKLNFFSSKFFSYGCAVAAIFVDLHGGIEEHLKKIENKSEGHSIRGIDFIYMINLDGRPEKFKMSLDQLRPFGIEPFRFSAVNGWKLTLDVLEDIGLRFQPPMEGGFLGRVYYEDLIGHQLYWKDEIIDKPGQVYFNAGMYPGTIGIVLSHLSILQDAYDSGYETIWVMEDDIEVVKDPNILSDLIDELDQLVGKKWDILFTDRHYRNKDGMAVPCGGFAQRPNFFPKNILRFSLDRKLNKHFRKCGSRFGAHSMIYRRSGIEKILNFIKTHKVFLPYDYDYFLDEKIHLFTVVDDVVANMPGGLTDNLSKNYNQNKSE